MADNLNDDMKEIVTEFIVESQELLSKMDEELIELEKNIHDEQIMDSLFRTFHTIKGSAGFLGFDKLVEIVHRAENILNLLRQSELEFNPEINDVLLESVDTVNTMLEDIKNDKKSDQDITPIINKLDAITNISPSAAPQPKSEKKKPAKSKKKEKPKSSVVAKKKVDEKKIVEEEKKLGEILVEEGTITKDQLENALSEQDATPQLGEILIEKNIISEKKLNESLAKQSKTKHFLKEQTIRVDIKRLDNVMNLVGELVLSKNQLNNLQTKLENRYGDDELVTFLLSTLAQLNLVTSDLQLAVMKARMQPIKKIFGKFSRMVRDLARDYGKKIDLVLSGENTELDKSVIEEIGDPLVHIIRNSIDHGIEPSHIRKENGKSETGTIKLSAYQKGNSIVIEIEDDGKGMNVEKISEKIVTKGLASKKDLENMTKKEIINYVFLPGFSTAETVSELSGRGVGMDVVKTNIMKLGGEINIDTELGKGTTMDIKLPITVAIIQSLLVQIGKEIYAIPLASVVEIIKISKSKIQTIDQREVVKIRDNVLPIIRLRESFSLPPAEKTKDCKDESDDKFYSVIIGFGEKQLGLMVEDLLGQEEVVIKSMGKYLSHVEGFAGATINGEGKVVLILDVASLFKTLDEGFNKTVAGSEVSNKTTVQNVVTN